MESFKENAKWYVYELINPSNGTVFYIGKGTGKRMYGHENEKKRRAKNLIIKEIEEAGYSVLKRKVATFWREKDAYAFEASLISQYPNLTNLQKNRFVAPSPSTGLPQYFTPAAYLLQLFTSGQAVADYFGITRSAVSKWRRPKEYQGTDGQIPVKHWVEIIKSGYMTIEQLNTKSFQAPPVTAKE